jgi:hypothetical protein
MTAHLGNCFKTRALACVASALLTAALGATAPPVDGAAAFERLKSLEGTWHAVRPDGHKAVTEFEVTAGGTVLLERYSNPAMPGGGKMVTAYHLDGGDLVLTHYCIARNQPTLRADRYDPTTGELQFEFVRATNLSSPAAGHMRRAKYRIQDRDHFVTEWEFFQDGKKTMTETESFTRATSTND